MRFDRIPYACCISLALIVYLNGFVVRQSTVATLGAMSTGITWEPFSDMLYVAGQSGSKIFQVNRQTGLLPNVMMSSVAQLMLNNKYPVGAVLAYAGTGVSGSTEGYRTAATFTNPVGVLLLNNSLFVLDYGAFCIRKISLSTGLRSGTCASLQLSLLKNWVADFDTVLSKALACTSHSQNSSIRHACASPA
jgi:hypothetical protein